MTNLKTDCGVLWLPGHREDLLREREVTSLADREPNGVLTVVLMKCML